MSVLVDLADRLEAAGTGTVWDGTTGDIVYGKRIDAPGDRALFLQTYAGDASRYHNDDYLPADERLNVQVIARGANQAEADVLAKAAWKAVQGRYATINGRHYVYIRAPQHPAYMGVDERDRPLVVFNLEVRRDGDLS